MKAIMSGIWAMGCEKEWKLADTSSPDVLTSWTAVIEVVALAL
jgi:hypothetical protein